jgi:hypothetical protein
MEQVWAVLGEAPSVEPPEVLGALLARLEREPRALQAQAFGSRWLSQLAYAAAVLLVAAAGAGTGLFAAQSWRAAHRTASESDYSELFGEVPGGIGLVSAAFDSGGQR